MARSTGTLTLNTDRNLWEYHTPQILPRITLQSLRPSHRCTPHNSCCIHCNDRPRYVINHQQLSRGHTYSSNDTGSSPQIQLPRRFHRLGNSTQNNDTPPLPTHTHPPTRTPRRRTRIFRNLRTPERLPPLPTHTHLPCSPGAHRQLHRIHLLGTHRHAVPEGCGDSGE